ncbi:MAG: Nif3-like dinuclear metal center hexameric protein [Gammaproteobacteria bacterium]
MPVSLKDLEADLNKLLQPQQFKDYCPNGLQVEGKSSINKIVSGVTASQALVDAAIAADADAILVHHGYFWRGEDATITGMKKRRLEALLANELSLLAYHLPLDAHAEFGNNAQLGKLLDLQITGTASQSGDASLVMIGEPGNALSADELEEIIRAKLQRAPLVVTAGDRPIKTIAWCTGGAQGFIDSAIDAGVDAYITGEASEQTTHIARERGVHFFAAGHHATERYGVQAVGEYLAGKFAIEHQFIDIDNPV